MFSSAINRKCGGQLLQLLPEKSNNILRLQIGYCDSWHANHQANRCLILIVELYLKLLSIRLVRGAQFLIYIVSTHANWVLRVALAAAVCQATQ